MVPTELFYDEADGTLETELGHLVSSAVMNHHYHCEPPCSSDVDVVASQNVSGSVSPFQDVLRCYMR